MENKKMSCWDFVFSSVKTHIDDLVRQADKDNSKPSVTTRKALRDG